MHSPRPLPCERPKDMPDTSSFSSLVWKIRVAGLRLLRRAGGHRHVRRSEQIRTIRCRDVAVAVTRQILGLTGIGKGLRGRRQASSTSGRARRAKAGLAGDLWLVYFTFVVGSCCLGEEHAEIAGSSHFESYWALERRIEVNRNSLTGKGALRLSLSSGRGQRPSSTTALDRETTSWKIGVLRSSTRSWQQDTSYRAASTPTIKSKPPESHTVRSVGIHSQKGRRSSDPPYAVTRRARSSFRKPAQVRFAVLRTPMSRGDVYRQVLIC